MATKIKIRRDTAANWAVNNPVLELAEFWYETDTQKLKLWDWVTQFSGLKEIPTADAPAIFRNKAIATRAISTANDATAVIDTDVTDLYCLTAMSENTTFSFTGTPINWQTLMIRFIDNWTARTLAFTGLTPVGVTLPPTTTPNKTAYVWCVYNGAASRWEAIWYRIQA